MPDKIDSFRGEHAFLSNFFLTPIRYEGLTYRSVEHAYQAAKSLDPKVRERFTGDTTPAWAKGAGRQVALREDWEPVVKLWVMRDLLKIKFAPGSELADRLLATGTAELVEGNFHGDTFWGVCNGVGLNNLGRMLMAVRGDLVMYKWLGGGE